MPYYIRVFGKDDSLPLLSALREIAAPAVIEVNKGHEPDWESCMLMHPGGPDIALIERNSVVDGSLGFTELNEFIDEVKNCEPKSGAAWLEKYLKDVKVIYSFQLLSGKEVDNGWEVLHRIYGAIWNQSGGILQADYEGFSNEDGRTIVWQFFGKVSGPWQVAVLGKDSKWQSFEIELSSKAHRDAFKRGEVPEGVALLPVE